MSTRTKLVEGAEGQTLELDPSAGEPLLTRAAITAAVAAVLSLAVSFGVNLTSTQQAGITAVALVVVPLAAAWWARRKTWSGKTVSEVLAANTGRDR